MPHFWIKYAILIWILNVSYYYRWNSTYFLWHFWVVHHLDELLHECWCSNLLVEWGPAFIHDDIGKAKGEEVHLQLIRLELTFDGFDH